MDVHIHIGKECSEDEGEVVFRFPEVDFDLRLPRTESEISEWCEKTLESQTMDFKIQTLSDLVLMNFRLFLVQRKIDNLTVSFDGTDQIAFFQDGYSDFWPEGLFRQTTETFWRINRERKISNGTC